MLTLPIKKKWFDMILSGEKKEEYREIKPYYCSRFNIYSPFESDFDNVIFKNEEAPVYKTLAIIEIVAVAISLFY